MGQESRLPFVGRIFWKVLAVIVVLLVLGWVLVPRVFDYEIPTRDYVGSAITALILSYLVHLWVLPGPDRRPDDDQ